MTSLMLNRKKQSRVGDSVEFDKKMSIDTLSLAEAKELSINFSQKEPREIIRLGIPTIDGSIMSSFKKQYYKKPQQVIDILKKYEPEAYKTFKKNFPEIFNDLKNKGCNI